VRYLRRRSSTGVGTVWFYLPDQAALHGRDPERLDIDRDWQVFGTGLYVWVLQTFLRLRAMGAPVRLTGRAPESGIVVTHADYVERLLAETPRALDVTIVSARSDRPKQIYADVEIVQNVSSVEDFQVFIPSWPQPNLIARRPERGLVVENVVYIGADKQLHQDLKTDEWARTLRDRGLQWESRAISFTGNDNLYSGHRWNDYTAVDVIVAMRPPASRQNRSKPAAKLTNAWAAGVPAIVSPDDAYRELRRSSLDYLEATNAQEALDAILRLQSDPMLFKAMVDNGRERAREFQSDRLAARWETALWHTIPAMTDSVGARLAARIRGYRGVVRRVRSRLRAQERIFGFMG
jgi:hypothetical protein